MPSISVSNIVDLHVCVADFVVVDHPLELGQFGRKLVMSGSKDVGSNAYFIVFGVVAKEDFIVTKNQGIL